MLYIEHPNKLAKLRQEAHLSQKQLAQELGVSQSSINYWENGGRTPSVKAAQRISEYFKIPISEIFAPYKDELCTSSVAISDAIEKPLKNVNIPLLLLLMNTVQKNYKVYKCMLLF